MPLSAIGGAPVLRSLKSIRLRKFGCTNRPFYHIVIMGARRSEQLYPIIEQLGTFDPMPNVHGERLISLNLDRLTYWIGAEKVEISDQVKDLLGLAGYLPLTERNYMEAWKRRELRKEKEEEKK